MVKNAPLSYVVSGSNNKHLIPLTVFPIPTCSIVNTNL